MGAGILDTLANFSPTRFAAQNQVAELQPQAVQANIAQTQQQTAGLALQQKIQQQQLQDAQVIRQAYTNTSGDPGEVRDYLLKNGISGTGFMGWQQHAYDLQTKAAQLKKDELANEVAAHEQVGNILQGIRNAPPEQRASAIAEGLPTIQRLEPNGPWQTWAQQPPTDQELDYQLGAHGFAGKILEQAAKKADIAKSQQETAAAAQAARLAQEAAQREQYAREHPEDPAAQRNAMTASQAAETNIKQQTLQKELAQLQEQMRHNLSEESSRKLMAEISAGRLAMEQTVNGLKYGPGTQEYWIKQLQDNPDSIKEMPPELRSAVGKGFTAATGLPLPSPVSATNQTSETAARNALDNITKIRELVKDPEVQSRLGPILGRLGNAEQAAGTAVGLSPAAEAKAQQLRTLMRYFVFQEGKALLSGRMPQQLMHELEQNSAAPKMDANTLAGALSGSEESAKTILDNVDRQRFGGKMRSRAQRGLSSGKTYTQADVNAAVAAHPGLTPEQADAAFKAKGWEKQQ